MPIASRRTLLPHPAVSPLRKWVALGCLVGLIAWPVYLYPIALVPLGVIIVAGRLLERQEKRRQARIAAQRPRESICTFVRGFDCRRTDTRVLRAVYEELQPLTTIPLRADDALEGCLHLHHEDLDLDVLPVVASRTGRSLVHTRDNPYYDRVCTVADLVSFFCAQPLA